MSSTPSSTRDEPGATVYRYRFGSAEFDEARGELRVAGLTVELEPRPLQVLLTLLRHSDELVTREELFDAVWGDRPTVDNVLPNAIAKLRKALGPEIAARIITLPRQGYRLSGRVERMTTGRRHVSQLDLIVGAAVPGRPNFILEKQLAPSGQSEVWLARHVKTGEPRVYKFSAGGERLASMKREATLYRVLRENLDERDDLVRIIDWNFETSPFYLECEYGGINLAEWAKQEPGLARLSQDARIALFLKVATAVAAAHSIGVLHKDLKPANVLLSDTADGSRVRIADFGSGRLLEPERLEGLGITALGLTVTHALAADTSGTALYIAPEVLSGQSPTVQSDLYALGFMLYQMIVGDLRRPLAPGWEREISDELLREDIAAATAGDPSRRLGSVSELCERLRNRTQRARQRDELQQAEHRAQLAAQRLERSRARRPWVVVAGVALIAGLAFSLWGFHREGVARAEAQRQAGIATAINHFMIEEFIRTADPNVSGRSDVKVIDALRAALPNIDPDFAGHSPQIQAALHLAMQKSLSQLSDPKSALEEGRKAVLAFRSNGATDLAALTESRIWMAYDLSRTGDYQAAKQQLDAADLDLPRLAPRVPELEVRALQVRGTLAADQLDIRGGYEASLKGLKIAERESTVPESLRDTLQFDVADSQIMLGETAAAEAALRALLSRQQARLGPMSPQTVNTQVLLANDLVKQRRFADAEALIVPAIATVRATWGDNARRTLLAESVLANLRSLQERYTEAAVLYEKLHEGMVALYGETNQAALAFLEGAANATRQAGDLLKSETLYRQGLSSARLVFKEDSPQLEHLRYGLAVIELDLRKPPDEAAKLLARLDAAALNNAEQRSDWDARLGYQQARLLLAQGHRAAARPLLERAQAAAAAQLPRDPDLPLSAIDAALIKL